MKAVPARRPLNRRLAVGLLLTLLASAWAQWWPREPALVAPAPVRSGGVGGASVVPVLAPAPAPLPAELPRVALGSAGGFDPFVGVVPPPPPPPKPAPAPPPVVAAPPAPRPPAMNYRFLGRVVNPEGRAVVFLAKAENTVVATVGLRLDDGYVVEAIETQAVRLHYPPLDVRVSLPIPPSPEASRP